MSRARDEGRILITFDRDFGELVFRQRVPAAPGVLYLRFVPRQPEETTLLISALFEQSMSQLVGHFTVVERGRVRHRRLPATGPWRIREVSPRYSHFSDEYRTLGA